MADYRNRKHGRHELLGLRVLESSDVEPTWRNLIRLNDVPWMADHCVEKDIVFPAAAYVAMAGAAVRQLTSSTAYTVQEVNIATAMLITEQGTREVITSMRKRDWTTSNTSRWWDFTISSENNGTWTKHCWGLVTDGCALATPSPKIQAYTRKVEPKRWYDTLARVGLNYGPRFRGLFDITASPVHQEANAKVLDQSDDPTAYALHPSTMDMILQSQAIALTRGQYRDFHTMWLPTFIEKFYVGDVGTQKTLEIYTSSVVDQGSAIATSHGVVGADVAYVLKGLKGAKMADSGGQNQSDQTYLSIEWHPSMDFVRQDTLIRPDLGATDDLAFLERLSFMCAIEVNLEAKSITSYAQPYFVYFLDRLEKQFQKMDYWKSVVSDAADVVAMTREERQKEIAECRQSRQGHRFEAAADMLWCVYINIRDILEGRQSFLDLCLVDGMLPKFYDESNSLCDITDWFVTLGLNKPYLRILEVGFSPFIPDDRCRSADTCIC